MGLISRAKAIVDVALHGDYRFSVNRPIKVCGQRERFEGKTVVVTGGYGAIGSAICRRFALEGAHVYAAGRSCESFNKEYSAIPGIEFLQIDVTDEKNIEDAFSSVNSQLDILVNCAGGSTRQNNAPLKDQQIELIDRMIQINLRGSLLCSRAACKIMARTGEGSIINISSITALHGKVNFTDYAASKAGIIGYTKSLALEMGRYGVRVNCVSPGFIQRGRFGAAQLEYNKKTNCLQTVGCAEDVAGAVTFLASDEARFITGQNLCVDGGRSLGLMGDDN